MEGVHTEELDICVQELQSWTEKNCQVKTQGIMTAGKVNVPHILREGKNYRPIDLTSLPWNIMEEVLREAISTLVMVKLIGNN